MRRLTIPTLAAGLAPRIVLACSLGIPGIALAQWEPAVKPGERIELSFPRPSTSLDGRFVRTTNDTVWLKIRDLRDTSAIPVRALSRLRVHRGKTHRIGRSAWKGFLVGAAVGGTIGLAAGLADPESAEYFDGPLGCAVFFGGLFAGPGMVLGGLLGISVDNWEPVPLPGR